MVLFALKSDEGYLKLAENQDFSLVKLNKASVYDESGLDQLRRVKAALSPVTKNLRIIQLRLDEHDFFE